MTLHLEQEIGKPVKNRWPVVVRLGGSSRELAEVHQVVYDCGPTFAVPLRTVTQREGGFELELMVFGDFLLSAHAIRAEGSQHIVLTREVRVDAPGSAPVSKPAPWRRELEATSSRAALLDLYVTALVVLLSGLLVACWPHDADTIGLLGWRFAGDLVVPREWRLMLIALLAGGIGSLLQAAAALVTQPGIRTLNTAWARWYLLRPLPGMVLGLLVYVLVRALFLSAGADASAVSPVGVVVLAGLVGLVAREANTRLQNLLELVLSADQDEEAATAVAAVSSARRRHVDLRQMTEEQLVDRARAVLRNEEIGFQPLCDLAKALKSYNQFGLARRLIGRALQHEDLPADRKTRLELAQQQALATYKDSDLPVRERFERALEILRNADDPATTNQETLGLTGSIYKRLWEVDGEISHLQRSLAYYRRGYQQGPSKDHGYTAINAAFVLDLLAHEAAREARLAGVPSATADQYRAEADVIRLELTEVLPSLARQPGASGLMNQWWFLGTVAEAFFGLGRYEEAGEWLQRAAGLSGVPSWKFESSARQLAALARLRLPEAGERAKGSAEQGSGPEMEGPREQARAAASKVLERFLGGSAPGVRSAAIGRVGLALSGGGFRASFFHIGVLAYLAERDVLRSIEVLSCVSGGSILGAHYYLEVRKLLKTKHDHEVTANDYIDLVRRLETDFLAGVESNIRCQVLSEFWTNLKAMVWPGYTRTRRLGELYESAIYSLVDDGEGDEPRYLSDLFVMPKDEPPTFRPKYDNWRRAAKVPMLVLNATTLNTGHNWQFTASWMGEPPAGIDTEIDGNYWLRRMYYWEAPRLRNVWRHPLLRWLQPIDYRRVRLGHAVAASSCVPGLFEPLVLPKLYPGKTVRLVDGGVHDNQGVASLLEQDCNVLLVSDASGQMAPMDQPSDGRLAVPLRAFSVSMSRVRQAQYHELRTRRESSLLRGLMFLHLKKDLDEAPVDWVDCEDPFDASEEARPTDRRGVLTRYGIRKDVQEHLAAIRTDLDSFSEAEAYALMTSGYRMAEHEFERCIQGFPEPCGDPPAWRFLAVEPAMSPGPTFEGLVKRLHTGRLNFFKVWWLSVPLVVVAVLLAAGGLAALVWAWARWGATPINFGTVRSVGISLFFLALALTVTPWIGRCIRFRKTLGQLGFVTLGSLLAAVAFKVHLAVFDRWFLRWGRLEQVLKRGVGDT
jgi:predicted acylesterase/phospholipase RssA/tetratricopeptide (TPR) repeat protein